MWWVQESPVHPSGHAPVPATCRIKPYLDQAAPLRGAGPVVSAAAQP
jgi:hypothetical protein